MPGQTPRYALPYPLPGDPITRGAQMIRDLAEAVEARLQTLSGGGGGSGDGDHAPTPVLRYVPETYASGEATTGAFLICSVTVPDPGYPYIIRAFGSFEAGHFNTEASKAVITARLSTPSGRIVGRGQGSNRSDWNPITVVPYVEPGSTPAHVGSQTVRFYGTSAISARRVQFSTFLAHAYVEVQPAT